MGGKELLVFEAVESRIKRSLLNLKCTARRLLKSLRDGVAVNGPKGYQSNSLEPARKFARSFLPLLDRIP